MLSRWAFSAPPSNTPAGPLATPLSTLRRVVGTFRRRPARGDRPQVLAAGRTGVSRLRLCVGFSAAARVQEEAWPPLSVERVVGVAKYGALSDTTSFHVGNIGDFLLDPDREDQGAGEAAL